MKPHAGLIITILTCILILLSIWEGLANAILTVFPRWEANGYGQLDVRELKSFSLGAVIRNSQSSKTILSDPPIAFESYRDGNYEVYVMDADGSNQSRITNNSAGDFEPVWSPDGKKIAFTRNVDGHDRIFVMDADGNNPTELFSD